MSTGLAQEKDLLNQGKTLAAQLLEHTGQD
jgi:hypothetical protein